MLSRPALAQDTGEKAETPAPEEPKEITISDFAIQAGAVEERLERIRDEIAVFDVAAQVGAALDSIEADAAESRERFVDLEARRMMSSELNNLRTELEILDTRTDRQIDKLSLYAGDLEKLGRQNREDLELWTDAFRTARRSEVPKSVVSRAASILQGLRAGEKELTKRIGEVLDLQSRAINVRQDVRSAGQAVISAQRAQADSIFERQGTALWVSDAPDGQAVAQGYDIRFSWPEFERTIRRERGTWIFEIFLVLAVGWLLRRIRMVLSERVASRQQAGAIPWEDQALEAVQHPWAAALLIALAATRFLEPDRVVDTIVLTWLIALPLWFVTYKEMVPASFRNLLVGLGLLGTLHIGVALVSGHPGVERALVLLELLLALAAAVRTIRFLRTVELPTRVRQNFWTGATSVWAGLAVFICLVGVVASILGYQYLATECAAIVVLCTIAATIYMALARIAEAVVSTSVHVGKLDAFRMVRANRGVTDKTLRRIIRISAVAVFCWSVADMTSVWRPIGRWIRRALSTDLGLGLGETGVTFGDFFAFFVVLWISWLIARFVSFVLQEEVLPRLHMQAGVPFALTTFTRYAIIAIGFVGALSVLGVSLDRVTIALSALGVGIGFGLQSVVNNFVSGFILLTERPIRLRDKVEIEGVLGNVSNIGLRASTIRTFDGAEVIVPNGDLISQRVVNWTLSARRQRVTIPVGVAYGTDPNAVLKILRKVAAANDGVFKDPAPLALFRGFGESSLDFELRIFMDPSDVLDVPSAVTVGINDALKEAGIEIPFPQRDLHLRGVPDGLKLADGDAHTDTDTDTDTS
ncbi:MAG: mechanosensitive ion channel domain-containing protein [Polyangiales bacterium]